MARILMQKGFTSIRPLAGGLDGWIEAGYFVEDETIVAIRRKK